MFEGSRLKKQRELLRMSQETLADKIEVHVNTIRRWEQGKQVPDANKLDSLATTLDTTVSYLSGETDENGSMIEKTHPVSAVKVDMGTQNSNNDANMSFVRELIKSTPMFIYEDGSERFFIPATPDGYNFAKSIRAARWTVPASAGV